jgi:tetrahydromethanopterin S-methyltransferase subunit A
MRQFHCQVGESITLIDAKSHDDAVHRLGYIPKSSGRVDHRTVVYSVVHDGQDDVLEVTTMKESAATKANTMHTPGPWKVVNGRTIRGADNTSVGICTLASHGPPDPGQCRANAQLIASSPELLAACKAMRDRITELANRQDCCWNDWPGSYAVDAAIAKAEGK